MSECLIQLNWTWAKAILLMLYGWESSGEKQGELKTSSPLSGIQDCLMVAKVWHTHEMPSNGSVAIILDVTKSWTRSRREQGTKIIVEPLLMPLAATCGTKLPEELQRDDTGKIMKERAQRWCDS